MRPAKRWRAAGLAFILFGGVGLLFLCGAGLLGLDGAVAARRWLAGAQGPLALPVCTAVFAGLAFVGVPQFVLIAAAVAAFGPAQGALYSWIGTLVSALVGFGLGRAFGAPLAATLGESRAAQFVALIGRHGRLASFAIRLAPFAPFVAVNMAAGAASIGVVDFTLGTALGILPKILLTAFAGAALTHGLTVGDWRAAAAMVLAGLVWIGLGLAARRWLRR
jgi:uncharacterized membrane protein YdjX (TVP38/TMEM64 family)